MLRNSEMQQQGDPGSSYYQYYQSHLQNPNPNPASFASAPPVSSSYSSSDYSAYSSSYPQYTDHAPNPNPQSSNSPHQPYNFPHLNPQPYYQYDPNQAALNYDQSNPSHNSIPNSSFSSGLHPSVIDYGNLYGNSSGYGDQGMYGDVGKQKPEIGAGYDYGGYEDGVYKYNGGKVVPYGGGGNGSGSGSGSSSGVFFDDYGRPIGSANGKEKNVSGLVGKVVKAVPKIDTQQDAGSGVQKFRVKLLSEGAGQSDLDVLCQIGLDGIQILDTSTSRTLRIYPLETVTRCEVLDSYIFAFWAKSSIDFEPRRIRLKSNSYTTNNIRDTVTAATFQIKEMGERNKPPEISSEQPSEKKKGFVDWVNLMKPTNEEKDHWIPDEAVIKCTACGTDFGAFVRRHHCRNCGEIFCDKCTQGRIALTADEHAQPVRVCDRCMAEVTQRLVNAKETSGKVAAFQSHEDLAKKLKEEMDKNRKTSTGLTSNGFGMQMKEVACPTCTVHLQVQLPASGSETIECSVCQHPFLVNAH